MLCCYENYVFKEFANYPLSCKMELLLSPFSVLYAPFQTKRRRERRLRERARGREETEKERLNGPLDQNDSCEEGSENKQGFRELLAA